MFYKSHVCILVLLFSLFANIAQAKLFNASEFVLPNGLQVVVLENHKAPLIKQMLWYKNGASDEMSGKNGSAHLLEHLMFRGTVVFAEGRFDEIMEQNGVISNAFTSQDYTSYHQFADISKLEALMLLEADRMKNLYISDENFIKERDIVYQERLQQIKTNPYTLFLEQIFKKLWKNHPYSNPISGMENEIKSLQKKDVLDYYHKFYTPENAILILSGDITVSQAKELAEKYYGQIKNVKNYDKPKKYMLDKTSGIENLIVYDKRIRTGRVIYMFIVPSYNISKKEALALEILDEYLGAEKTSPLYKKLVEEEKFASEVSVHNGFSARGYDTFSVMAALNNSTLQTAKNVENYIKISIKDAITNMSSADFEAAKKRILADVVYVTDSADDSAYLFGSMLATGISLNDANTYDEQIKKMTLGEFKSAVESALGYAPSVIGVLLPEVDSKVENDEK